MNRTTAMLALTGFVFVLALFQSCQSEGMMDMGIIDDPPVEHLPEPEPIEPPPPPIPASQHPRAESTYVDCPAVEHFTTGDFAERVGSLTIHPTASLFNGSPLTCLRIGPVSQGTLLRITASSQVTNDTGKTTVGLARVLLASEGACAYPGDQITEAKGTNPAPVLHHLDFTETRSWITPRDYDDLHVVHWAYASGCCGALTVDPDYSHMDVEMCTR